MPQKPVRETAYGQYVNTNIPHVIAVGEGAYNYKELAELVGLKPTQHFRRRVNWLAADGIIKAEPVFTSRGGIETRFRAPEPVEKDMPF